MPKIRIELEMPDSCLNCNQMAIDNNCDLFCRLFKEPIKDSAGDDMTVFRCQPCLDAEVKEGE